MKLIWIGLLLELLVLTLLKPFINVFEIVTILLIGIHAIFVVLGTSKYKKSIWGLFCFAYALRLFAMFWDIYARNIFIFPSSGSDTEGFFYSANIISNDLSLLKDNIYGGIYSKILGVLFNITSPERLLGQYLNVILGLTIIIIIYKTLRLLEINARSLKYSILIVSFLPNAIIHSGILLRENFISAFVVLSFYYFAKWYKYGLKYNVISSLLYLAIASSFHSGVIGLAVGYVFMYMFYQHKSNKLSFSAKTVFVFITFAVISILIYTQFNDVLLGKFNGVDEFSDIYDTTNTRSGGSVYLTGLKIDSIWELILFSPIKMIYFLTSPLPTEWRGLNDIITFFFDGLIYLSLIFYSFTNYKKHIINRPIVTGVIIMLLAVIFTFSIGISNAGTAMRHRQKILSIIIICYAIIADNIKKYRQHNSLHFGA